MKASFSHAIHLPNGDWNILVKWSPGFFATLFGAMPHYTSYEGDGTVWHCTETGDRADTPTEVMLAGWAWFAERNPDSKPSEVSR